MMAAKRSKRRESEKLPENEIISKKTKTPAKKTRKTDKTTLEREEPIVESEEEIAREEIDELPYANVEEIPQIQRPAEAESSFRKETKLGYRNQAPLQADERAIDLIKEALKNPINITTEDLLNISEPARQELKKLLTRKRVEKKSVSFISNEINDFTSGRPEIKIEKLPTVSYEILEQERQGIPKGSLIIGDPVVQYLGNLEPGEQPKKIVVATESQGLRAIYPLINGNKEIESLLDGGSQIVSMAKETAVELSISWNPKITVYMQSANRALEETLGLAKDIPFLFGNITVYLQIHIMDQPAYKVLLGRPFDSITESLVKNEKDGGQTLTLTDPNTGTRCMMSTYERGKIPKGKEKPLNEDFQFSMN
jgi:hypothetical protein